MVTGIREPHPRRERRGACTVAVPRSGPVREVLRGLAKNCGEEVTAGIKTAALGPFRGYANAIRDELPEAITVMDAFHFVKLGSSMVDEVRRRVQPDTLGHRGRKRDPLYGIRRTLQIGAKNTDAARHDR
jgi:transposase